jgi:hypothetical protein
MSHIYLQGAHVILDMLVNECLRNFTYLSSDIAYAEANRTAGPPMTGGMYVPAMSMYAPPPQYMPVQINIPLMSHMRGDLMFNVDGISLSSSARI